MKKLFVILPLVIISILFIVISLLLLLNKNSKSLLKNKLKIGAIIISLTALLTGAKCSDNRVTCYDVAPPRNNIVIEDLTADSENNYTLNLSKSNIINFNIKYMYQRENFTFRIIQIEDNPTYDKKEVIIKQGEITILKDVSADSDNPKIYDFQIEIDKTLKPDRYFLIVTDNNGYDYLSLPLLIKQ